MTTTGSTEVDGILQEIADRVAVALDTRPLMTLQEAAEHLRLSYSGLRSLVASGRLASITVGTGDGSKRIEARAIDAYLAGQREAEEVDPSEDARR